MMGIPTDAGSEFNKTVTNFGEKVRLRTYLQSFSGAAYDDPFVTTSGNDLWFYGMIQPLDVNTGGEDYKYLQAGVIRFNDSRLFVPGSVTLDEKNKYKLFIGGSPSVTTPYEIVPNGVIPWNVSGTEVYKKVYVRILNGGSFVNEY